MSDLTGLITNKNAIALACRINDKMQTKLVAVATEAAIKHLRFNAVSEVTNISDLSEISAEDTLDLIGLYISILKVFMESDEKQFHDTMIAVGFSEDFVEKFPLKHKIQAVSLFLSGNQGGIQKLSSFKWRVDISFTCGVLKVPVPPKIIIHLQLNSGLKYIFELDIQTFHRLRFDIALAFKEFNVLKNSIVLKNKVLI